MFAFSSSTAACEYTLISNGFETVFPSRVSVALSVTVTIPFSGKVTAPLCGLIMLSLSDSHVISEPFLPFFGKLSAVASLISAVSNFNSLLSSSSLPSSADKTCIFLDRVLLSFTHSTSTDRYFPIKSFVIKSSLLFAPGIYV